MQAFPLLRPFASYLESHNTEQLLDKIRQESREQQQQVISDLQRLLREGPTTLNYAVCIGSGNAENVLALEGDVTPGAKHLVEVKGLYGGSAVNQATRLLAAGYDAFPILAIGNDSVGEGVRDSLLEVARANGTTQVVQDFLLPSNESEFFDPNILTSLTTIVVHESHRTIFTQKLRNGGGRPTCPGVKQRPTSFSEKVGTA